ncbi:MAG: hypothetical protein LBF94_01355 [Puniceicoccales bacterium]|jgi:hypothetical protein|nr:hypothetical protein [Puniceicoccales bacterium]
MDAANNVNKTKFQSFKEQVRAGYFKVHVAAKHICGEIGSHCDTNIKDAELWAREAWSMAMAKPTVVKLWSFSKFIIIKLWNFSKFIIKLPVSLAIDVIKTLIRLGKGESVCEMAKKFAKYAAEQSEKLRRLWQDEQLKQQKLNQ